MIDGSHSGNTGMLTWTRFWVMAAAGSNGSDTAILPLTLHAPQG
jgi:hypothetical protein